MIKHRTTQIAFILSHQCGESSSADIYATLIEIKMFLRLKCCKSGALLYVNVFFVTKSHRCGYSQYVADILLPICYVTYRYILLLIRYLLLPICYVCYVTYLLHYRRIAIYLNIVQRAFHLCEHLF